MNNELGERRDLEEEAESIEYQAMCDQVRDEIQQDFDKHGIVGVVPNERVVNEIATRRLRKKYESACGK